MRRQAFDLNQLPRNLATRCCVALLGMCLATTGYPEIYRCTDPDGRIQFRDRPCVAGDAEAQVEVDVGPAEVAAEAGARSDETKAVLESLRQRREQKEADFEQRQQQRREARSAECEQQRELLEKLNYRECNRYGACSVYGLENPDGSVASEKEKRELIKKSERFLAGNCSGN